MPKRTMKSPMVDDIVLTQSKFPAKNNKHTK
jgi:hypothetical protein